MSAPALISCWSQLPIAARRAVLLWQRRPTGPASSRYVAIVQLKAPSESCPSPRRHGNARRGRPPALLAAGLLDGRLRRCPWRSTPPSVGEAGDSVPPDGFVRLSRSAPRAFRRARVSLPPGLPGNRG